MATRALQKSFVLPSFVCVLLYVSSVYSTILSYNNKYSNKQYPYFVSAEAENNELLHLLSRSQSSLDLHSIVKDRERRSPEANSDKPEPSPFVKNVTLNGTTNSGYAYVHWIGQDVSQKIFVLTFRLDSSSGKSLVLDSQVWRSSDYGSTFTLQNDKFQAKTNISLFYTFATNSSKLLFTDVQARVLYTTADELEHVHHHSVPVDPDIVLTHPSDDKKLLLYSLSHRQLYVSFDFAASWTMLAENVSPKFYWGHPDYDTDVDVVHMEELGSTPSQAIYKSCIAPKCTRTQEDVQGVGPFLSGTLQVHKEYMFIQKSNFMESEDYLLVSYKRGPFKRAYFPSDLKTDDFMLLDVDDGQVFVAVNHGNQVNLYLSEATGQFYVLSLENVYHTLLPNDFDIDFHEVRGMNWTFIVNRKEEKSETFTTHVSFDKGGNWRALRTSKELQAQCKNPKTCKLQLHSAGMLSETSAPGVILAHGNLIGPGENGSLAVFSSRDGGWTWRQGPVSGGVHHFNILDQGGVLTVMLDGLMTGTKTNTMHYSCDEGLTWKKFPFIKDPLIVKGVLTEPGSLTVVESVFGNTKNKEPWTLIKLNFSSVLGSKCQEKDYEKWLPQDYNNNSSGKCILGRITEYSRRKVTSPPCYSGGVLKPKVKTNATCACTTEDYECDFGYEESGNECKKSSWFFDGYVAFECKKGMYSASQGYRKIPADSCIEGAEFKKRYDRVNKECPKVRPLGVSLTTETMNVRVGIETSFHMDQREGSKTDTTYTWNFQDGSKPIQRSDFTSASVQSHTFPKVGRYNVSVSAENSKGSSNATLLIHVQEQIDNLLVLAPWAGKMGTPVNFQALASMGYKQAKSEHQHYVWTFGDEEDGDHPLLTWSSNVLHVFKVARTYQGTVEAVNSISSLHKHFKVRIFDAAVILLIDFSPEVSMYQAFPYVSTLFMHRVRQEISEALGVSLLRIECVFEDKSPHAGLLYIFPSSDQGDQTMQELSDRVKTMVKNKELKVSLFGKPYPGVELLSASDWTNSTDGPSPHGHGPNLKPVYIAAPILVLAVLVSTLTFFYCRRRQRAARHFTLLSSQDDSDALLDDDDEAPLDLNLDLGGRDTGRDDQLLDGGGSHLVMVTGGGTADNAETC